MTLDNRRVSAYLSTFATLSELTGLHPSMDDIFTGVSRLQTEGQGSTRPLSRRQLFHVLSMCDHITADAAAQGDVSLRHAQRYAGHARVASKAIARLLDQRHGWKLRCRSGHLRAVARPSPKHRRSLMNRTSRSCARPG